MDESYIQHHPGGGATFAGPDAMRLFAAASIKTSINLYLTSGIKASRMHTVTNMLSAAGGITGKAYLPRRKGLEQAVKDLEVWINFMKSAMPVINR